MKIKLSYIISFTLILLLFILLKKKEHNTNTSHTVEIVVARYNEDVSWLDNSPFNNYPITIYEKGLNPANIKANFKSITLPNVGRCDHTYLHHIIENYDNLADVTIFLPGSAMLEHKKGRSIQFVEAANDLSKVEKFFDHDPNTNYLSHLYNFTLDDWVATNEENKKLNPESTLEKSSIRPFGKWYEHIFKDKKISLVWYTGVLIATKERIRKNPIELYKTLISYVDKHSNPEAGHYIERVWASLFI